MIRLLLSNIKEWLVPYLQNAKISKIVIDQLQQYPYQSQLDFGEVSYMGLVTHLLIKFIQGTSHETATVEFARENLRINALGCEFFEALMVSFSKEKKPYIIMVHLETLLNYLGILIETDDSILQIQVLNLLKIFVLSTKEVEGSMTQAERKKVIQMFQSDMFIINLLKGLQRSKV